jgi:hypothetical protein
MEVIMAEEKQVEVELIERKRSPLFDGPRTATWKIENETFRRLAHTGEFAPEANSEAEPKSGE